MSKRFLGLFCVLFAHNLLANTKFVIITASYKNARWYLQNVGSVLSQDYDNFQLLYTDDCSSDQTADLVQAYLKSKNVDYGVVEQDCSDFAASRVNEYVVSHSSAIRAEKDKHKVVIIKNKQRMLPLHNLTMMAHACENNEVAIVVDGDDLLAHKGVLKYLNNVYIDKNIWLTYGQFKNLSDGVLCHWNIPVPQEIVKHNAFRKHPHLPTHLRTFYAGLFKKIKLQDFLYNGAFFDMTADVAITMPLLEMAGDRFKFIPDVLLIYNDLNSLNEHKRNQQHQLAISAYIRAQVPYTKLPEMSFKN